MDDDSYQKAYKEVNQLVQSEGGRESLRFSMWELMMVVQGNSYLAYVQQRAIQVSQYSQMRAETLAYITRIHQNPLRVAGELETLELIQKDVERTYQEVEMFQQKHVADMMQMILIVWDRCNRRTQYKQGMNEIVGLLVMVYFDEHLEWNEGTESRIYWLFCAIMEQHKLMFQSAKNRRPSPILDRINVLQNYYLKLTDTDLFKYFKFEDIQIQIFMLRWYRCMLSREFELPQIKTIWDHIFKNQSTPVFMDCLVLSMFVHIRDQLLYNGQSMETLRLLLNYPAKSDYTYIIMQAYNIQTMITLAESSEDQILEMKKSYQCPRKRPNLQLFEQGKQIAEIGIGGTSTNFSLFEEEKQPKPKDRQCMLLNSRIYRTSSRFIARTVNQVLIKLRLRTASVSPNSDIELSETQ